MAKHFKVPQLWLKQAFHLQCILKKAFYNKITHTQKKLIYLKVYSCPAMKTWLFKALDA